ncbi:hypothetical protein Kfla_2479 [Kribbella flavida DSM 17836]|uniref:DUF4333 domain-containing protein n=1 Tax=Kribbella flavida (strain DSM 17836 / JCM 10339 / NBRC 14399) TaxID=479435 RepID=D2PWA1_KRIFD|nr:hypothetical protein [Kribbella flavida]ADB31553.1 hypothetical protein Kfla_2479 [Kribbella flavida DSM 17836]
MPIAYAGRVLAAGAAVVLLLAGCSDDAPSADAGSTPSPSAPAASTGPSSAPIPTPSAPTLTPLPTPSKPWPTPKVTGTPDDDAPLATRIRFAIAKQVQVAAGKAATTKVTCPGIEDADEPGKHELTCTVNYAGKTYRGQLTVDAEQYSATYKFTSQSVAIVKPKVVDAVQRAASGAAKVTCTMDDVTVVKHTAQGIACDVTTVENAVQPYRARISGNGQVLVSKA